MREFNLPFLFFSFPLVQRPICSMYYLAYSLGLLCCLLQLLFITKKKYKKATRAMTTIQARTKTFTYNTPRERNIAYE